VPVYQIGGRRYAPTLSAPEEAFDRKALGLSIESASPPHASASALSELRCAPQWPIVAPGNSIQQAYLFGKRVCLLRSTVCSKPRQQRQQQKQYLKLALGKLWPLQSLHLTNNAVAQPQVNLENCPKTACKKDMRKVDTCAQRYLALFDRTAPDLCLLLLEAKLLSSDSFPVVLLLLSGGSLGLLLHRPFPL
jgi:hypothetical protein